MLPKWVKTPADMKKLGTMKAAGMNVKRKPSTQSVRAAKAKLTKELSKRR